MASYITAAPALLREHDIAFLNLPNTPVESLALAVLGRFFCRRPLVAVYQCDLLLPPGLINRLTEKTLFLVNVAAGLCFDRITAMTEDYANHSSFLRLFQHKREIILPAVVMPTPAWEAVTEFRGRVAPGEEHLIGFAGRFSTEKGVEYMLEALELIHEKFPRTKLLLTVHPESVVGERRYWKRMQPMISRLREHCEFLGTLSAQELAVFYAACDVTILPSINSTEAFGLVQLESMLCGTPVVATDLPGVRVAILTTGMGRVVPPRDSRALADAVIEVITNRQHYLKPRREIEENFSFENMVDQYEELFQRLTEG